MDEAALHDLLSGRRRDPGARLLRGGLHLLSGLYSSVMSLRDWGYRHNWLRIHRVSVPVISLGNITTGGTGKTPLAAWLANWLVAAGRKPGLISRGYRSLDRTSPAEEQSAANDSSPGNDEKQVLDRLCPDVPHLQQRDRVQSAGRAINECGRDVLVLDDGFQHRRLHRDLDLVLIDALQPWGYEHVLPRGLLREPLAGLRRADMIIITRANQCSTSQRQALRDRLKQIRGTDECVEIAFVPRRLVDPHWQPQPIESLAGKRALVFCGIGNPGGFRQTVESLGVRCEGMRSFPDHHHYESNELSNLAEQARALSADVVLTTQKDLVKIPASGWSGPPLYAVEIAVEFLNGKELLESLLKRALIPLGPF